MAQAAALRDAAHGARITFSPKVFIPLTMLCRDRAATARSPSRPRTSTRRTSRSTRCSPSPAGARRWAATKRCSPSARRPRPATPPPPTGSPSTGTRSTVDYLVAAAAAVLAETGLLPHANAGALSQAELERLRAVSPSQGMMIETLAARLGEPGGPHAGAPDKTPERRLATLEAAGRAAMPFTTGILVGIGETRRRAARRARRDRRRARPPRARAGGDRPELPAQARHRDVARDACRPDEFLWTVAAARMVLGPTIHLQAPPNLSERRARVRSSPPGSTTGAASRRSRPTT